MPKKYFPKKWKILQKLRLPTTPSRIKNFYTDGKNLQLSGGLEETLREVLVEHLQSKCFANYFPIMSKVAYLAPN